MEASSGTSESTTKIEKLGESNYHAWKQKIVMLLSLRSLHSFITKDPPKKDGNEAEYEKWFENDLKARAIIGLSLTDENLEHVRDVSSAKEMWTTIKNVFERHTLLNNLAARRNFYTVTMESGEKMLAYLNRVKQLAAVLKSMSVTIEDKEIGMVALNGLPPKFDGLIVALDALGSDDKNFSFDLVKSRLLQEEQRFEMREKSSTDAALFNRDGKRTQKNRDYQCDNCGRRGHTAKFCWGKDSNGRRPAPPDGYVPRRGMQKNNAFVGHVRCDDDSSSHACRVHVFNDKNKQF